MILEEFDAKLFSRDSCTHRSHHLEQYTVQDSKQSAEEVLRNVDLNFFEAYSNPVVANRPGAIRVQSLEAYTQLLRALQEQGWDFGTALDLTGEAPAAPTIHLRHDVDGDLRSAIAMSQIESELGIKSTYYFLHTAPYYGMPGTNNSTFLRHFSMADIYREFEEIGHEVGLHNDALQVAQNWGIDGSQALTVEIEWLRSAGLSIAGTVAHNSVGTYGAANFAIFKGRPRSFSDTDSYWCIEKGKMVTRLGLLCEKQLDLAYEGNDLLWGPDEGVASFALLRGDVWYGQDAILHTLAAMRVGTTSGPWFTTQALLNALQSGDFSSQLVVLHIHPMYFGFRRFPKDDLAVSRRLATSRAGLRLAPDYDPYKGRPVPSLPERAKTIAVPECKCRNWSRLKMRFFATLDDFESVGALRCESNTVAQTETLNRQRQSAAASLKCSRCGLSRSSRHGDGEKLRDGGIGWRVLLLGLGFRRRSSRRKGDSWSTSSKPSIQDSSRDDIGWLLRQLKAHREQ